MTSLLFKERKKKKRPRTVVDRISTDDDGQPNGDNGNECNGRKVSIERITSKRGFSSKGETGERKREAEVKRGTREQPDDELITLSCTEIVA